MQYFDTDLSLWSPLWITHRYMLPANQNQPVSRCFCVSVSYPLKTNF